MHASEAVETTIFLNKAIGSDSWHIEKLDTGVKPYGALGDYGAEYSNPSNKTEFFKVERFVQNLSKKEIVEMGKGTKDTILITHADISRLKEFAEKHRQVEETKMAFHKLTGVKFKGEYQGFESGFSAQGLSRSKGIEVTEALKKADIKPTIIQNNTTIDSGALKDKSWHKSGDKYSIVIQPSDLNDSNVGKLTEMSEPHLSKTDELKGGAARFINKATGVVKDMF